MNRETSGCEQPSREHDTMGKRTTLLAYRVESLALVSSLVSPFEQRRFLYGSSAATLPEYSMHAPQST